MCRSVNEADEREQAQACAGQVGEGEEQGAAAAGGVGGSRGSSDEGEARGDSNEAILKAVEDRCLPRVPFLR